MPGRRRSADTMERDANAADLFRQGKSYRQIAAEMGWNSPNAAFEAVRRAAQEAGRGSLAAKEALRIMLERHQDYRRAVYEVLTAKHYVTTQAGHVVEGPDGLPLHDDAPVLNAVDRLVKIDQEEAKLLGLYAPTKSRVEVITEDVVDAELKRLAEEIAEHDGAGTRGPA
jgi:transposase-like protein